MPVRSSGRMLQAEMSQDVVPCALCASFPANHSVEAAEVPTPPTEDVLPKALPVALSLIKPARSALVVPVRNCQEVSESVLRGRQEVFGTVRKCPMASPGRL